jgi:hypothetical protein
LKLNFIIGIGRSGTTLLTLLLEKQGNTEAIHDIPFITFFNKTLRKSSKLTLRDHEALENYILNFTNDSETVKKIKTEISKIDSVPSYSALIENLYKIITTKNNTTQVFDKEPSYTLHVDLLTALFPDAKFIYMVRDPRANFLSRKENPNNRTTNIHFNCYRWKFFNQKGIQAIQKHPEKIKIVRYEDLVKSPESVLHDLSTFIGFDLKPDTFSEPYSSSEKVMIDTNINPSFQENHLRKLAKEVNSERLDSWKSSLTKEEIAICDSICFEEASFFGYKKSNLNIKSVKKSNMQFIKAKSDFYKEYALLKISASRKLRRIKKLNP